MALVLVFGMAAAAENANPGQVMQAGNLNHFLPAHKSQRFFYLSSSGDDTRDGLTPATAWKSLVKVNATAFRAGDCLLCEGGSTFAGTLNLRMDGAGSAVDPVIITSYGNGRATIDGGAGAGIVIDGCAGVIVRELNLIGAGRKTGNRHGVGVRLAASQFCIVDQVEVSGFQRAGVELRGCSDLRLTNVYAHDNGFAGITSTGRRNNDIYLGDCRAINNPGDPTRLNDHSGNGIVLDGVSNGTVEYCEAAQNGWDMPWDGNGPAGIWCEYSDKMLIQYCISHDNKTHPGAQDGGGFDFDGGTTNSVMQYNYSYSNAGCGYLCCENAGPLWKNNVIRYNISQNDGLISHKSGIVSHDSGRGAGYFDCDIYNNVVYNEDGRVCVKLDTLSSGFTFCNNIFIIKGNSSQVIGAQNAVFQGNCYYTLGGGMDVDGITSLAEWSKDTGQEMINGTIVGMQCDPGLTQIGAGAPLTDPRQLPHLFAYRLKPDSPCSAPD